MADATMRAAFSLRAGKGAGFALRWAPVEQRERTAPALDEVAARLADIVKGWRSWEHAHDVYEGTCRDLVRLSTRVLRGLTYRPTGTGWS